MNKSVCFVNYKIYFEREIYQPNISRIIKLFFLRQIGYMCNIYASTYTYKEEKVYCNSNAESCYTRAFVCAHTNVIKYKLLASLQWMYNVAFEEQIFPDYSRLTLYSFPSFFASWHEVEMSASRTRSMSEKKKCL